MCLTPCSLAYLILNSQLFYTLHRYLLNEKEKKIDLYIKLKKTWFVKSFQPIIRNWKKSYLWPENYF